MFKKNKLLIRREEKNIWSLVPILFLFNIWNICCCRVVYVWQNWMIDFNIDQLWYWKWLISTIIYMDNGHWRHGLVWTMDIEDIWLMDVEEYIEYWWCPYRYIHYWSWLETSPEFLIEQCSEVPVPVSNCWCSTVGPRYLACYYYTATQQSVIAIVYCTKQ